jgi:hypothetical protein
MFCAPSAGTPQVTPVLVMFTKQFMRMSLAFIEAHELKLVMTNNCEVVLIRDFGIVVSPAGLNVVSREDSTQGRRWAASELVVYTGAAGVLPTNRENAANPERSRYRRQGTHCHGSGHLR